MIDTDEEINCVLVEITSTHGKFMIQKKEAGDGF